MARLPSALDHRKADHDILPLFLKRWSPRAMTGKPVSSADLMRLFEAARWAPSTYNEQEWRFLYAHREGPHWDRFFKFLAEGNQAWCKDAGVLIVGISHKVFSRNGKPNPVHTLDVGLAMENLLLQAAEMGLVAHGMMGFDGDFARRELGVPEDHQVEVMIAIGHPGDPDQLADPLKQMDLHPSSRKPVKEFAREGKFSF